jgi:hypothetical protein
MIKQIIVRLFWGWAKVWFCWAAISFVVYVVFVFVIPIICTAVGSFCIKTFKETLGL